MTLTLAYRLPRTSQRQTQQEAVLNALVLAAPGELDFLRLVETGRTVFTAGNDVQIEVALQDLPAAPPLPSFVDLYPTTADQEAAVGNLFTTTLQAKTNNRALQVSITIVP